MSDLARIEGSHHDPDQVNRLLDEVAEKYNLVAPATSCGRMPEGFEVVFSAVKIDAGDTYGVGGGSDGRGLTKAALDQIAGALGVTWVSSRRTDDGSDPHYCQWQVVGRVQNFDGTWREFSGAKEVDLRTGSPQVQALEDRAKASAAKYKREVRADGQIREMRLHIMSHAETKARLRAIRSLGIKTSYSAAELRKPFVVARLMLTGHTADPELRRLFALEQFRAGLQAQISDVE